MSGFGPSKPFFCRPVWVGAGWGVAKIELREAWAGVAEPLRALMAEIGCEAESGAPNPVVVSAQWTRVSDAIRAAVRAQIAEAQLQRVPKR